MKDKIYKNALIGERLVRLNKTERQKVVIHLLKTRTERQLADEIGINHSTIHDWQSKRQDNKGEHIHVSLSLIYRRLQNLKPKNITDWGRIEQIRDRCEELLRLKGAEK